MQQRNDDWTTCKRTDAGSASSGTTGTLRLAKLCPFCGSDDLTIRHHQAPSFMHCECCGTEGPIASNGGDALLRWNNRPDPAGLLALDGMWNECSGDPASCPENEGRGCCKPNPTEAPVVVQRCG